MSTYTKTYNKKIHTQKAVHERWGEILTGDCVVCFVESKGFWKDLALNHSVFLWMSSAGSEMEDSIFKDNCFR